MYIYVQCKLVPVNVINNNGTDTKVLITVTADYRFLFFVVFVLFFFCFVFFCVCVFFRENKVWPDDSHKMPSLIFLEIYFFKNYNAACYNFA